MPKNYIPLNDRHPFHKKYAFIDMDNHMAELTLASMEATRPKEAPCIRFGRDEFHKKGQVYCVRFCNVPKADKAKFKAYMNYLKTAILISGGTDYEEFCENLIKLLTK